MAEVVTKASSLSELEGGDIIAALFLLGKAYPLFDLFSGVGDSQTHYFLNVFRNFSTIIIMWVRKKKNSLQEEMKRNAYEGIFLSVYYCPIFLPDIPKTPPTPSPDFFFLVL